MKRILSFVLLLIICAMTFTACQMPEQLQGVIDKIMGKEPAVEVTYNLDAAIKYLTDVSYKGWLSDNTTPSDVKLVNQVIYMAQPYKVTWAVDNEAFKVVVNEDGTMTLDVPEMGSTALNYALTATVADPNGESKNHTFNLVVPALKAFTFDEFMAAETGTLVTVSGVVTAINAKTNGQQDNGLYFQDENGGYYAYKVDDAIMAEIQIGMTITVTGKRDTYGGAQVVEPSVTITDKTIKTVAPTDFTDLVKNAKELTDANLLAKNFYYVTLKGVQLQEVGGSKKDYYYFMLNTHKIYFRISSSNNPMTEAEENALIKLHGDNFGATVDITGIVSNYNNAFYIIPVGGNTISNIQVSACQHTGGTATCEDQAVCDLCGEKYGKLADHVGGTATCTSYATCTVCEKTYGNLGAHTFTEGVCSCGVTNVLSTEKEYYLGMYQGKKADVYYFIGEMVNNYYYGTSTETADAVKVKLEAVTGVDGAYHITFTVDGAKKYLSVTERTDKAGSATITIVDTVPANHFTYNTEYNTFVTTFQGANEEVSFFLGNYNTNTSLSGSAAKYLADGNFVASLYVVSESTQPEQPEQPAHTCADANGDYVCDTADCGKVVAPAEGSTLTIEQALKLGALYKNDTGASYATGWYYVTGVIADEPGSTYGGCTLTDGTNSISIYGLKDSTGTNRYDAMEVKPVKGDTVKLYGQVGAYYEGIQMSNSNVVELTAHGDEHNYVDGKCTKCFATQPAAGSTTLEVSIATIASANSWANGIKYESFVYEGVTFSTSGTDANTGKYYTSDNTWRVYPSGQGTLTITAPEGKTITSVTVVLDKGSFTYNGTALTSGTAMTVSGNSITLASADTTTEVKSIVIIYQ